jgi:endonuclease VIII
MAEGDTILRAARRIEDAIGGQQVSVRAGNGRGRAAGVERLDGRRLDRVEARGKHLLLHFDELTLHSHLGMSGSWQVGRRGERRRKPASAAWLALSGDELEAVQFGGPTLRVLSAAQLRRDPMLARLGPDILAPDFDLAAATRGLRASPDRELGEALLDQRLLAGIGNIFKSEACFAARTDPWRQIAELSDGELRAVLDSARRLMQESVTKGRPNPAVYGRAGRPCPVCGTRIAARGQGDANRRTYWCPRCQAGERRAK